ncbi:MAG: hypothetical protein K2L18_09755 [Acetatifactor sp.]|nr:hypothetical protein [Acetatifactor sp.]
MYKRLNMGKDAARMQRINDFVLEIFHYFATYKYFRKDAFFKFLGTDGQWFATCCANRGKLQELLGALKKVPFPERGELYEAMRADASFQLHEGDDAFVFQESRLDRKLVQTAAKLTSYLYDEIFAKSGFQENGTLFQYKELKEQLCKANDRFICPVCLNSYGNLKELGQIDHFFPKMKYPALTFRPENLTLICMLCNEGTGKGVENPMTGTNLTELYLPYVRGAEGEMTIAVQPDGESGHGVKLLPGNSDPKTEKRINNDDRIFHLTARWNGQVEGSFIRGMDDAREMNTADEVKAFLKKEALANRRKADRHPNMLVEAACFEYLSSEGEKTFLAAWEQDRRDRAKML